GAQPRRCRGATSAGPRPARLGDAIALQHDAGRAKPGARVDARSNRRGGTRLLELSQQALSEMRALLTELRSAEDATIRLRWDEPSRRIAAVRERGLF